MTSMNTFAQRSLPAVFSAVAVKKLESVRVSIANACTFDANMW